MKLIRLTRWRKMPTGGLPHVKARLLNLERVANAQPVPPVNRNAILVLRMCPPDPGVILIEQQLLHDPSGVNRILEPVSFAVLFHETVEVYIEGGRAGIAGGLDEEHLFDVHPAFQDVPHAGGEGEPDQVAPV